jgi:hypothetical protein
VGLMGAHAAPSLSGGLPIPSRKPPGLPTGGFPSISGSWDLRLDERSNPPNEPTDTLTPWADDRGTRLVAWIQERETQQRHDRLTKLFNSSPTPPEPLPEPEHVHGRGTRFRAGCEGCQAVNRAWYHAHKQQT